MMHWRLSIYFGACIDCSYVSFVIVPKVALFAGDAQSFWWLNMPAVIHGVCTAAGRTVVLALKSSQKQLVVCGFLLPSLPYINYRMSFRQRKHPSLLSKKSRILWWLTGIASRSSDGLLSQSLLANYGLCPVNSHSLGALSFSAQARAKGYRGACLLLTTSLQCRTRWCALASDTTWMSWTWFFTLSK